MRETETSDMRLDLERAAAALTDTQRRALWLWCQGYTLAEIAVACESSDWGVRRMLHYGLWIAAVALT